MNPTLHVQTEREGRRAFAPTIQLGIVAFVLFWGGFFTADFLVSGIYTWPRTSRILTVTAAIIILTYEFVYQDQRNQTRTLTSISHLKRVFFACVLPYMLGAVALLVLFVLSNT